MDKYSEMLGNVQVNVEAALRVIHTIDDYISEYGTSIPSEDIEIFNRSTECLNSVLAKMLKGMSDDGILSLICLKKVKESSEE